MKIITSSYCTIIFLLTACAIFTVCISFKPRKNFNQNWTYVCETTLNNQLGSAPGKAYQVDNYVLKVITKLRNNVNIDDNGNREEYRENQVEGFELINLDNDSIYEFSINESDTILRNTKIYSLDDKRNLRGLNVLQLRDFSKRIIENEIVVKSKKDSISDKYFLELTKENVSISLCIDPKIKSPFNLNIRDENNDIIKGALVNMSDNINGLPAFRYKFEYTPSVPKDKIELLERFKFLANVI